MEDDISYQYQGVSCNLGCNWQMSPVLVIEMVIIQIMDK
jgi:hypothetical protein